MVLFFGVPGSFDPKGICVEPLSFSLTRGELGIAFNHMQGTGGFVCLHVRRSFHPWPPSVLMEKALRVLKPPSGIADRGEEVDHL